MDQLKRWDTLVEERARLGVKLLFESFFEVPDQVDTFG